ncbi:MAG: hypothetical protein ABIP90_01935 [Vicinamibacterales bacterium]
MSRLHVDVATDRRYEEASLASALGDPTFEEFAQDALSEFGNYEEDDFEDSRDLDDWLSVELRLGQEDDD